MQSGFWNRFVQRSVGRENSSVVSTFKPLLWFAGAVFVAAGTGSLSAETLAIATQTQLTSTFAHTATGTRANFVIHVSPEGGAGNASGVVTLMDGTRDIGSAVLNADGDATLSASGLAAGEHSIHAVYNGTDTLAGSLSAEAQVVAEATGGTPTFTATAGTPVTATSPKPLTTATVSQGGTATFIVTLTPVNGFSNYVTLSCSGLPADTACTFLPVNVLVSGTAPTTSVLSVETFGPTTINSMVRGRSSMVYAFLFPGVLAMAGLGMRRRPDAWKNAGLLLLIFAGLGVTVGTMSGCSQRYHYLNKSPVPSPGTAYGPFGFVIEAQATSGVTVTTQTITNLVVTVTAPAS